MRIVGIVLCLFLGLIMFSIASIFLAITVPNFGGVPHVVTIPPPPPAEAVPGSGDPAPVVPVRHTRVTFALFPLILLGLLGLGGIGLVVRLFRSEGRSSSANTEEIRMMQEIHHGLSGLTRRVESLETLLLDRAIARDGEEWKKG